MTVGIYKSVAQSLKVHIQDQMQKLITDGVVASDSLELIDWDNHASIEKLPEQKDLIGPNGIGIVAESSQEFEAALGIAVSTIDDVNMFRMREILSRLMDSVLPETALTVYNADTAQPVGKMIVLPYVRLNPSSRSEIRAFQTLEIPVKVLVGTASALSG